MRRRLTLYDTLGVGPGASEHEIRSAFRKLTRQYHPDRFIGEDRIRAEKKFQEITEAFNVLSDPAARERYDKETGTSGDTSAMDPAEIARRLSSKGAQELRAGNLQQAVDDLRLAVNHDDSASRAHYFLALALSRVPGQDKEALRHADRAAQLEPNSAPILAEAAARSAAVGMRSRAQRFAEQSLALDPTNAKAQEVVDSMIAAEDRENEGFLGRFRRKG